MIPCPRPSTALRQSLKGIHHSLFAEVVSVKKPDPRSLTPDGRRHGFLGGRRCGVPIVTIRIKGSSQKSPSRKIQPPISTHKMPTFRISFVMPTNKLCPVCQLQSDRLSSWCTQSHRDPSITCGSCSFRSGGCNVPHRAIRATPRIAPLPPTNGEFTIPKAASCLTNSGCRAPIVRASTKSNRGKLANLSRASNAERPSKSPR